MQMQRSCRLLKAPGWRPCLSIGVYYLRLVKYLYVWSHYHMSTKGVTETLSQGQIKEAELDSTPFWRKIYWQALSKKSFDNAIEDLEKSNKLLWKMVKLKSFGEPSFPLGAEEELRSQVHLLHTLIRHVNCQKYHYATKRCTVTFCNIIVFLSITHTIWHTPLG